MNDDGRNDSRPTASRLSPRPRVRRAPKVKEDDVTEKKESHRTVSPNKAITPVHGPKEAGEKPAINDGNTIKKPRLYRKSMEKLAAFEVLVQGGIEKTKAAEALGYKGKTAYVLQERIEKQGKKLDVVSQSMVRLAHRAVKNCLKGQPWGKIEVIKDSTALAAAQVIVDRHQPKKQENSPASISYISISLDAYREEDSPDANPIYRILPPVSGISAPETGQPTYPALREPAGGGPEQITREEKAVPDDEL